MSQPEIICIGCPMGCKVTLKVGPDLRIENIIGNRCKEGKKYALAEFQNPVRIFTSTILTQGGIRPLSVKTDRPVHKSQLKAMARAVVRIKVSPPVKTGQEIVHNILGTNANLVATSTLNDQVSLLFQNK